MKKAAATEVAAPAKQDRSLAELMEMAKDQQRLEAKVAKAALALKEANEELARVQTDLLPTAMEEIGMSEFKLEDGSKITLKPDVACSITQEKAPAAFTWLTDNGHGGLIKSSVNTEFDIGDTKTRAKVLAALKKLKLQPELKMSVHASTLKAFVKECLKTGIDIPFETFSVFPFKKTIITAPKKK